MSPSREKVCYLRGRPTKPESMFLHFPLRTDNCDAAFERARAAGMQVTMKLNDLEIPSKQRTSVRIAFWKRPDGEIIEFFQHDRT